MNLNKLDKISLGGNLQAQKLLEWGNYYVESLKKEELFLGEGLLILEKDETTHEAVEDISIYFKKEKDSVRFKMLLEGGKFKRFKPLEFIYHIEQGELMIDTKLGSIQHSEGTLVFAFRAVQLYFSSMEFLERFQGQSELVKESKLRIPKKKKKKNGKVIKSNSLLHTTYKINLPDIEVDSELSRMVFDRQLSNMYSKGHWRTVKEGKYTWVKPSIKKNAPEVKKNVG